MKILIASNNQHKKNEIQNILNLFNLNYITLVTPESLGIKIDVEESSSTLEGNALLKAQAFAQLTGLQVIADDTGLEIDSLNGQPGVHSARFADENCLDSQNRTKVLSLMQGIPDAERTARFRTVICYINSNDIQFIEGICRGRISDVERGINGFGYDSIFIPLDSNQTFAEMSPVSKNKISHRSLAIKAFAELLKKSI